MVELVTGVMVMWVVLSVMSADDWRDAGDALLAWIMVAMMLAASWGLGCLVLRVLESL